MQIIVRPARAEELQAAEELVVRSINDLTVRHGFGAMASLRPADFQQFSLNDDPDGLWVAEADGELAGFAFSWISIVRLSRPSRSRDRRYAFETNL